MMPIRVAGPNVEPVSVAELRAYLRLDPDDAGAEDALLAGLIAAARAGLEAETRRILVPGTWRLVLERPPRDRVVPLPLSPVVALERTGFCEADGSLADLSPGLAVLSADRIEAPCLRLGAGMPDPAGRALLVELSAGYGGDLPLPPPLRLSVLRHAAARYEHRGDDGYSDAADLAASAAPFRRLRL